MSLWLFPHLPPFAIFIFFSSHFTCCCQHQNYQMDPRPHEATEAGVQLGASATRVLLTWPKGTQGAATPACRHLPAPSSGCALAQPTLRPAPCPEGNPTGERSPPTPWTSTLSRRHTALPVSPAHSRLSAASFAKRLVSSVWGYDAVHLMVTTPAQRFPPLSVALSSTLCSPPDGHHTCSGVPTSVGGLVLDPLQPLTVPPLG